MPVLDSLTAYEEGGHAKEFGSVRYMFKSFRVISFVIDNAIMHLNLYHSRSSNHTELGICTSLGILKLKFTFASNVAKFEHLIYNAH